MRHKAIIIMDSNLTPEEFEVWLKQALENISSTSEKTVDVTYIHEGSQLDFLTD